MVVVVMVVVVAEVALGAVALGPICNSVPYQQSMPQWFTVQAIKALPVATTAAGSSYLRSKARTAIDRLPSRWHCSRLHN